MVMPSACPMNSGSHRRSGKWSGVIAACTRCGAAFASVALVGIVMGVHEGGGRVADAELLQLRCPDCREAI